MIRKCWRKPKTMSAKGARFVLDLIEKFRVNFAEDVALMLIERAGDEPSGTPNAPVVKVLESLKVEPTPQAVTVNGEEYEIEE